MYGIIKLYLWYLFPLSGYTNLINKFGGNIAMKVTEKKKPIPTMPKGVWESSTPYEEQQISPAKHGKEISIDAQGNGYPTMKNKQETEDKSNLII